MKHLLPILALSAVNWCESLDDGCSPRLLDSASEVTGTESSYDGTSGTDLLSTNTAHETGSSMQEVSLGSSQDVGGTGDSGATGSTGATDGESSYDFKLPCDDAPCDSPLEGQPCILPDSECPGTYDKLGNCNVVIPNAPTCTPEDCGTLSANCAGAAVDCYDGCSADCVPGAECQVPNTSFCEGNLSPDCFCVGDAPPAPSCMIGDCGPKPGNCTSGAIVCGHPLQGMPCLIPKTTCESTYDCEGKCSGAVPAKPECAPGECSGLKSNCSGSVFCGGFDEICDGMDNDCDDKIDEGLYCPCGNGIIENDEECDPGCVYEPVFMCFPDCTLEYYGDNINTEMDPLCP